MKRIWTEKAPKQNDRRKRSGHAFDSLDLVHEGLGHLDRHTSGLVLGMGDLGWAWGSREGNLDLDGAASHRVVGHARRR